VWKDCLTLRTFSWLWTTIFPLGIKYLSVIFFEIILTRVMELFFLKYPTEISGIGLVRERISTEVRLSCFCLNVTAALLFLLIAVETDGSAWYSPLATRDQHLFSLKYKESVHLQLHVTIGNTKITQQNIYQTKNVCGKINLITHDYGHWP